MTSQTLTMMKAGEEDVLGLVALVNGAYRGESGLRGWTTEANLIGGQRVDAAVVRESIANPDSSIVFVAREKASGALAGCVHLEKLARQEHASVRSGTRDHVAVYLGMLTVDVKMQSHGVGNFLLSEAEIFAARIWIADVIELTVLSVRQESMAWYRRRGYRLTGEKRPFPYGDERFGKPFVAGLEFDVLAKNLAPLRP